MSLPIAQNRTLEFAGGQAIGSTYQWPGGQYCAIHTAKGLGYVLEDRGGEAETG